MSTSRSSPVAGPSRSSSPDAAPVSSYRIERFNAVPANDLMVTSRSKRSTAGNRLKALLDQELEKDEVFAEVENDIDFEANENEDGVDIVDSDFDRDSDDDARAAEDESEGERELEAQEKADKQKRRAQARNVGIIKRPPPPAASSRSARRPAPPSVATPEPKRRRISFAPEQPSSSSSPTPIDAARRRSSARSATVQSKLEVESRLEEASQRRAAQPVKQVVKKKGNLTQDALIAEALEVEEENRESLRRFLEQEEERRAKQRQRKERITGPFVRWMSVGLRTKVVEEEEKKGEKSLLTGAADNAVSVQGSEGAQDSAKVAGEQTAEQTSSSLLPVVQSTASADSQSKDGDDGKGGKDDVAVADASTSAAENDAPTAEQKAEASGPATVKPNTAPPNQPTEQTASVPASTAAPPSSASLTLDPVIAARQQAALLRSSTAAPSSTTHASSSFELQARTLLSVERMPSDWEWLDEFQALLGTHCAWDAFPFVPSRNRPLKPRQSICPITGLPALYRDPRTGIAYANAYAYKVITRVLQGGYVWSGGHYQDSGDRGKRKQAGGKVGTGAVPPEMGIWLDDEQEPGPGKVWTTARNTPTTQANQPTAPHPPTQPTPTPPSATPTPDKPKSKPGFDVVLTNALAPGDEKAVLAAALSLPAGSTRSGRRVHRS